jgi:hypothetical protein
MSASDRAVQKEPSNRLRSRPNEWHMDILACLALLAVAFLIVECHGNQSGGVAAYGLAC